MATRLLFFFLKKTLGVGLLLIFNIFRHSSTWHAIKNSIKLFDYWSRYTQFWFFRKGFGNGFSTTFCYDFTREMYLALYSVTWPNWYIGHYLYCKSLKLIYFPIKHYMTRIHDKNLSILRTKNPFKTNNKKHFSSFLKGFHMPKLPHSSECTFNSFATEVPMI